MKSTRRMAKETDAEEDSDSDEEEKSHTTNTMEASNSLEPQTEHEEDSIFKEYFVGETKRTFSNQLEISQLIEEYQETSGIRLIIKRSNGNSKTYFCGSHVDCCFRAKFGPIRSTGTIVLKEKNSSLSHSGESILITTAKDGRSVKRRKKFKDVITAGLDGYMKKVSSEMIYPYLQKFKETNPGTVTVVERDLSTHHIQKLFLCPGIMNDHLKYVRPIMSLDAIQLKSDWKGTLLMASVKTACDEVYPVALGIVEEDENHNGWKWFLEQLKTSLPILVSNPPTDDDDDDDDDDDRIQFPYFSFISSCENGLIQALAEVFPLNHSCYCAAQIRRNIQRAYGGKVAENIIPLSKTFSLSSAEKLMKNIPARARQYLASIPSSQWRNTAWMEDSSLPPRYGIVTCNMSDSWENVFGKAMEGNWFSTMDQMLQRMVVRISEMRGQLTGKTGVVPIVKTSLEEKWESCSSYNVIQLEEEGTIFTVSKPFFARTVGEDMSSRSCNLDVYNERCDCGEWQGQGGVPCIHALAYFKQHLKLTLDEVLSDRVNQHYTYEDESRLLKKIWFSVCIDHVIPDESTLPPHDIGKRPALPLRPLPATMMVTTKQRIRNRSRFASNPENSPIVCGRCGMSGHNKRTCLAREAQAGRK